MFLIFSFNLKLGHKALFLVAIPLLFQLIFVTALMFTLKRADHEIWRERHSKAVIQESNNLLRNFVDSGLVLYMFTITGRELFLEKYEDLNAKIPYQIDNLKILLRDSPNPASALERLRQVGNKATDLLAQGSRLTGGNVGMRQFMGARKEIAGLTEALSAELAKFVHEQEKAEQIDPAAEERARNLVVNCLLAGVGFNIVLAFSLALYFNGGTISRLKILMENTRLLALNKPLREPVKGGDEISELDAVFHKMAADLADLARRKQELISMVSHDLRTPLTSVQATLTLLSAGALGELPVRASKAVLAAESNTQRLIDLINDLLDIESIEAGQLKIEKRKISLQEVLEQAIATVEALSNKQGINIIRPEDDLVIVGDPGRLVQVVVNLLSNAIKFSPPESVVTIAVEAGTGMATVKIIDQGRGIPEEHRETIFERFAQVQAADGQRNKGTGLGLPICKAIVASHGGAIGADSPEDRGSIFWFTVPLAEALPVR